VGVELGEGGIEIRGCFYAGSGKREEVDASKAPLLVFPPTSVQYCRPLIIIII